MDVPEYPVRLDMEQVEYLIVTLQDVSNAGTVYGVVHHAILSKLWVACRELDKEQPHEKGLEK